MKKTLAVSIIALAVLASPVVAVPTAYLTVSADSFPHTPYTVNLVGGLDTWAEHGATENFVSFCVQSTVSFKPGANNV